MTTFDEATAPGSLPFVTVAFTYTPAGALAAVRAGISCLDGSNFRHIAAGELYYGALAQFARLDRFAELTNRPDSFCGFIDLQTPADQPPDAMWFLETARREAEELDRQQREALQNRDKFFRDVSRVAARLELPLGRISSSPSRRAAPTVLQRYALEVTSRLPRYTQGVAGETLRATAAKLIDDANRATDYQIGAYRAMLVTQLGREPQGALFRIFSGAMTITRRNILLSPDLLERDLDILTRVDPFQPRPPRELSRISIHESLEFIRPALLGVARHWYRESSPAAQRRKQAKKWIEQHGSPVLREMAAGGPFMTVYRSERLGRERPGWSWFDDMVDPAAVRVPLTMPIPRQLLALRQRAIQTAHDAKIQAYTDAETNERLRDNAHTPASYWLYIMAKFLGRRIVFNEVASPPSADERPGRYIRFRNND